jgi:hypothetical protein
MTQVKPAVQGLGALLSLYAIAASAGSAATSLPVSVTVLAPRAITHLSIKNSTPAKAATLAVSLEYLNHRAMILKAFSAQLANEEGISIDLDPYVTVQSGAAIIDLGAALKRFHSAYPNHPLDTLTVQFMATDQAEVSHLDSATFGLPASWLSANL